MACEQKNCKEGRTMERMNVKEETDGSIQGLKSVRRFDWGVTREEGLLI